MYVCSLFYRVRAKRSQEQRMGGCCGLRGGGIQSSFLKKKKIWPVPAGRSVGRSQFVFME